LSDAAAQQSTFDEMLTAGDVLVQPLVNEVLSDGEWSLMFIEGAFSHAVLKRPTPGDFRVQYEFGGVSLDAQPPREIVAQAEAILETLRQPWLYARVDGCDVDSRLMLMELERIEPSLLLDHQTRAPGR